LKEGFPVRPGHGTQGQTITVWANYFEVLPQPGLSFFRYAMAYDSVNKAPKLSKVKEKRLWGLLLEDQRFNACLSDYKANLISRTRLPNTPIEIIIPFRAEGEDSPRDDPHQYRVTIQETGTINVMDLLKYLQTKDASTPELAGKLEIIQALNFAIGNHAIASKDIATVGDANKHYLLDRNPANMRVLGSGMEALRGYYKSVRTGTARILLNVNVTHGVFYEPIRLDRLIPKLGTGFLTRVSKYLKYLRVNRLHLPAKKNKRGQVIPNATTVWDVATTNDGNGEANPPQVMKYGAGPKEVKFWLVDKSATAKPKPANIPAASPLVAAQSSKTASPLVAAQSSKIASPLVAAQSSKKGKGKGKGGPGAAKTSGAGEAGVYISVYDYFQKCRLSRTLYCHI
jgi:eukaryotic translation initiation factor 2C